MRDVRPHRLRHRPAHQHGARRRPDPGARRGAGSSRRGRHEELLATSELYNEILGSQLAGADRSRARAGMRRPGDGIEAAGDRRPGGASAAGRAPRRRGPPAARRAATPPPHDRWRRWSSSCFARAGAGASARGSSAAPSTATSRGRDGAAWPAPTVMLLSGCTSPARWRSAPRRGASAPSASASWRACAARSSTSSSPCRSRSSTAPDRRPDEPPPQRRRHAQPVPLPGPHPAARARSSALVGHRWSPCCCSTRAWRWPASPLIPAMLATTCALRRARPRGLPPDPRDGGRRHRRPAGGDRRRAPGAGLQPHRASTSSASARATPPTATPTWRRWASPRPSRRRSTCSPRSSTALVIGYGGCLVLRRAA